MFSIISLVSVSPSVKYRRQTSKVWALATTGEISADGHFTARNSLGTCRGQVTGRLSKETCTNALRQSCRATYERAD